MYYHISVWFWLNVNDMGGNNMRNKPLKEQLERYMDAGFPIIYIHTFEEEKVDEILSSICIGNTVKETYEWNGINGFLDFRTKTSMREDCTLEEFLIQLKEDLNKKNVILKDIIPYFEDPKIVSIIKGLANMINQGVDATLIIVANALVIPSTLEKFITILEMDYLSNAEIKEIINDFIKEQDIKDVNENIFEEMASAFKGLTEYEIKNILALSYADDVKTFTKQNLQLIFEQKQQMIKKAGILEMIPLKESLDDIGGLENLKNWLNRKAKILKNISGAIEFGVDLPKGVLIAGIPGCGKSLNAKAAAHLFEVPLLRLDIGRIMGKYVGESEGNLRKAISLAEAISPCVLWIDELEKSFVGIGGQGGSAEVTTRLFGNFLTWLQEKNSPVFVVATANDITTLPPEFLRKGRFDEIFYVNLPNEKEREKIFEIHIKKRRPRDIRNIQLSNLAKLSDGFSGADIEGVVKDAVEKVFSEDRNELTIGDIVKSLKNTTPISKCMKDSIEKLIAEYDSRNFKNASR